MIKNTQLYRAAQEGMKQEKIEIAKSMIQENMNLKLINKITELTKEEIEKLSE